MGRFFLIILLLLLTFSFTGVQREERDIDFRNPPQTSLAVDLFSFWLPSNTTGDTTFLFQTQNLSQNSTNNSDLAISNTNQDPEIKESPLINDNNTQSIVSQGAESLPNPVISNNATIILEVPLINSTTNTLDNLTVLPLEENSTMPENPDVVGNSTVSVSQYVLPEAFGAEEMTLDLIDIDKNEAGITLEFNLINNVPKQRRGTIDFYIIEEGKEPSTASPVEAGFNFRYQVGKNYILPYNSEEQSQAILNNTAYFTIMVELFENDQLVSRIFVPIEEKE